MYEKMLKKEYDKNGIRTRASSETRMHAAQQRRDALLNLAP